MSSAMSKRLHVRHWLSTAAAMGLGATAEEDILELAEQASGVVQKVSGSLPRGFPDAVCAPIFDGLLQAAERLLAIGR